MKKEIIIIFFRGWAYGFMNSFDPSFCYCFRQNAASISARVQANSKNTWKFSFSFIIALKNFRNLWNYSWNFQIFMKISKNLENLRKVFKFWFVLYRSDCPSNNHCVIQFAKSRREPGFNWSQNDQQTTDGNQNPKFLKKSVCCICISFVWKIYFYFLRITKFPHANSVDQQRKED